MSLDFAKVDTLSAINPVGYITCADELSAKQYVPGKICAHVPRTSVLPLARWHSRRRLRVTWQWQLHAQYQ